MTEEESNIDMPYRYPYVPGHLYMLLSESNPRMVQLDSWEIQLHRPFSKLRYDRPLAPSGYRCYRCRVRGVKLWRRYNDFRNANNLLCLDCIEQQFHKSNINLNACEHVLYRVPAVPSLNGDNFYVYEAVDKEAQAWWRSLPDRRSAKPAVKVARAGLNSPVLQTTSYKESSSGET